METFHQILIYDKIYLKLKRSFLSYLQMLNSKYLKDVSFIQ